jgi:hypothetical protein
MSNLSLKEPIANSSWRAFGASWYVNKRVHRHSLFRNLILVMSHMFVLCNRWNLARCRLVSGAFILFCEAVLLNSFKAWASLILMSGSISSG